MTTDEKSMEGPQPRLCYCEDGHWRIAIYHNHETTWAVYTIEYGDREDEVTFDNFDDGFIHPNKWTGRMRVIDQWPLDATLKPLCEVLSDG